MLEVVEKKDAGIRNFITRFAESAKARRGMRTAEMFDVRHSEG
jgi:hypothetical protein